jgi:hypothetical protein
MSSMSIDTHAHYRRDAAAAKEGPISLGSGDLTWTANGKKIKVNGRPFHLKGVSWFGFELQQGMLMGLEQRRLDEILQFLQDNGFNALRLPFSTKWALDYDRSVYGNFKDGELNGMTRRHILNKVCGCGVVGIVCFLGGGFINNSTPPNITNRLISHPAPTHVHTHVCVYATNQSMQVIERAGDYNILVMLDSHRLNDQEIPELWYK